MQRDVPVGKWIGAVVKASYCHGSGCAIDHLKKILGASVTEVIPVRNEAMMRSTGEYYLFLNVADWQACRKALSESSAIASVVGGYESPAHFMLREIREFGNSADVDKTHNQFMLGDIVLVTGSTDRKKQSMFVGLTGIVERVRKRSLRIVFRLESKLHRADVPISQVKFNGNLFEVVVIPPFTKKVARRLMSRRENVGQARRAIHGIISEDELHRKQCRCS
jgi:ribosomal protein L21E